MIEKACERKENAEGKPGGGGGSDREATKTGSWFVPRHTGKAEVMGSTGPDDGLHLLSDVFTTI